MKKMSEITETNDKLKNLLSRKDFINDRELNSDRNKKLIDGNSIPAPNIREGITFPPLGEVEKVLNYEDFISHKRKS